MSGHFSHVTKSSIFKNLNLRRKADRKLSGQFAEKPLQAPKIIFRSPKLIGQKILSYEYILKGKRLKFTILGGPTFQVLLRGNSPLKKT